MKRTITIFMDTRFQKVYKDGLADENHTDSRVLLEEGISVTPLQAAFRVIEPLKGEIKLTDDEEEEEEEKVANGNTLLITIPKESYIYDPITEPFKNWDIKLLPIKVLLILTFQLQFSIMVNMKILI